MNPKEIIEGIVQKNEIRSVFFVGCGASKADLYPAKYFLDQEAKKLRISHYTANEFNYATPTSVDETAIVITASLGGTTPETVQANAVAKRTRCPCDQFDTDSRFTVNKRRRLCDLSSFFRKLRSKTGKNRLLLRTCS